MPACLSPATFPYSPLLSPFLPFPVQSFHPRAAPVTWLWQEFVPYLLTPPHIHGQHSGALAGAQQSLAPPRWSRSDASADCIRTRCQTATQSSPEERGGGTPTPLDTRKLCVLLLIQLAGFFFVCVYKVTFFSPISASEEPDTSLSHNRVNIGFKFIMDRNMTAPQC